MHMQNNAGIPKFIPFQMDVVFKNIRNEINQQKHSINISKYICMFSFKSMEPKRDGHVGLVFPTSPSPLIDFLYLWNYMGLNYN